MAAIQSSAVQSVLPFTLDGHPIIKDNETILTDGSRTVPLAQYTIMAQIASTKKWVPWLNANLGDTTGMQTPRGILMTDGGYTSAVYAAGDITGVAIAVAGEQWSIDGSQLVFDKGSTGVGTPNTLDSIPTVPTNQATRAEAMLWSRGIYPTSTVQIDLTEN
jgi:hypothetical protein